MAEPAGTVEIRETKTEDGKRVVTLAIDESDAASLELVLKMQNDPQSFEAWLADEIADAWFAAFPFGMDDSIGLGISYNMREAKKAADAERKKGP